METIYQGPRDYDLEHEGDCEDVAFYVRLLEKRRPRRVMELGSGGGRVTLPLAPAAAASGVEIVGLEREASMLEAAYLKRYALSDTERTYVSFFEADMRDWQTAEPFDLVIAPCSSLSHLLTLDEQIATWHCAYRNLGNGGRLVADLAMPNLAAYGDSMQTQLAVVEIDIDTRDPNTGSRHPWKSCLRSSPMRRTSSG